MSRFLTFVTAIVVLAIVQAALAALVVALAIMLLFYSVTRPRETLIFVGTLALFGLANAQPLAFIIALTAIGVAVVTAGAWRRRRGQSQMIRHRLPRIGNQSD